MTIPLSVPSVIQTTATATTGNGFLEAIRNAIHAEGTHWEVVKYTAGAGLLLGQKDPSINQRIWITPSAPNLTVGLDPDSRVHDPTGELLNFSNIAATASSANSGGVFVFSSGSDGGWDSNEMSGKIDVVETDDCLSVFFYGGSASYAGHGSQSGYWYHGFQAGKIMSADNPLEDGYGIDGSGVVAGWPGTSSGAAASATTTRWVWANTSIYSSSFPSSLVRTGLASWEQFTTPNCRTSDAYREVDGKLRLTPLTVQTASGAILGRSRYFRLINVFPQAVTLYNVSGSITDGNHQSWLARQHMSGSPATGGNLGGTATYSNNFVHLWTTQPIKIV